MLINLLINNIHTKSTGRIEEPNIFIDTIMYFRVPLSCNVFLIVVSLYTSALHNSNETIMMFYEDLRSVGFQMEIRSSFLAILMPLSDAIM